MTAPTAQELQIMNRGVLVGPVTPFTAPNPRRVDMDSPLLRTVSERRVAPGTHVTAESAAELTITYVQVGHATVGVRFGHGEPPYVGDSPEQSLAAADFRELSILFIEIAEAMESYRR